MTTRFQDVAEMASLMMGLTQQDTETDLRYFKAYHGKLKLTWELKPKLKKAKAVRALLEVIKSRLFVSRNNLYFNI